MRVPNDYARRTLAAYESTGSLRRNVYFSFRGAKILSIRVIHCLYTLWVYDVTVYTAYRLEFRSERSQRLSSSRKLLQLARRLQGIQIWVQAHFCVEAILYQFYNAARTL